MRYTKRSGYNKQKPSAQKGIMTSGNREARFLAKITTGTTHEIRNVLAIINESAGLMEDMAFALEKGRPLNTDSFKRSIARIGAQVERGTNLMSTLNRFAHSLDHDRDQIELHQEAAQVALLAARPAQQKGHSVEARPGNNDATFSVNRLHLQMALFTGVECCLEQLPQPGTVVMNSGYNGGVPATDFSVETENGAELPAPSEASCWSSLIEITELLGAEVDVGNVPCHFRISFPLAANE